MRRGWWIAVVGVAAMLAGCGASSGDTPVEEYKIEPGKQQTGPAVNVPPEVREKIQQQNQQESR
ncbi:MAG: hypothetical protein WHU10_07660 [Fimbriimonadales bacterium]